MTPSQKIPDPDPTYTWYKLRKRNCSIFYQLIIYITTKLFDHLEFSKYFEGIYGLFPMRMRSKSTVCVVQKNCLFALMWEMVRNRWPPEPWRPEWTKPSPLFYPSSWFKISLSTLPSNHSFPLKPDLSLNIKQSIP